MADLVSIGFEISTKGIKAGIQELDKLAKSGDKVQNSVDKFGNELKETDKEMGRFIDKSGRMREKNGQFVKGLEKTNATLKKTAKNTSLLNKAGDNLTDSVKRLAAAYTGFAAIRQADSYQLLADRVALATKETGDFASVQAELFRISQDTGTGLQNNVELFDRIRIGAQELGKSNTEVLQLVEAVDMLAASGGTSQEAVGNATLQLSQALAGGILRAEEFNSIVENTPKIAQAIAEGLNTSIGGLRGMVLEGEVLADDVFSALLSQTDQISEDFEEMPIRLGRATTTMGNSVTAALGKIDSQLGVTGALADGINDAAGALDNLVEAFQDGELDDSLELLSDISITLASAAAPYAAYTTALTIATAAQRGFNFVVRANPIGLAISTVSLLAGAMATLDTETERAADEVERLAKASKSLNEETRERAQLQIIERRKELQEEILELQKEQAEQQEIIADINKNLDIGDNPFAPSSLIDGALLEDDIGRVDKFTKKIEALQERYEKLGKSLTADEAGSDSLADSLTNGFFGGVSYGIDAEIRLSDELVKSRNELIKQKYDEELDALTRAYGTQLTPLEQLTVAQDSLNRLILVAAEKDLPALTDALDNVKQQIKDINNQPQPFVFDFEFTDQYQEYADAMSEAFSGKKGEPPTIDWESIGAEAAQTIGQSLADGDFSDFGDALGSAAASAVGSAVTAGLASSLGPFSAVAGGLASGVVSVIIGGKKQTGSSTTVSLAGGQASGFNQRNFSGLFGSSSSRQDLGSGAISALNNSVSVSLSAIDNALLAMGSTITTSVDDFSTTVKVGEGEFTDAIEDITANYISANFAAIEDYARAGETFVQTFERINEEMVSVIDSFTLNTTSGSFQEAVDRYTETQSAAIEANAQANIESIQAQIAAIQALPDPTRETGSGNIVIDTVALTNRYRQIEELNAEIAEQTSRLGSSLQTATVDFSNAVLESIATIEGISSDDAVSRLNQLTASYEENYFTLTEQTERAIESAKKELEEFADLGIDETTSLDAFQSAYEAWFASDAFNPSGVANWLLAADALAEFNNVVDDIDSSGTFESITDFVKDLMGLAVDGTETLAAATAQYQETLALAQTGDADALAAITTDAQAYLDALEDNARSGTDVIIARAQVGSEVGNLVPAFAGGGSHTGGLRLVGENGPEIEATGPSRIFSNSDTKKMLDNTETTKEISMMRSDMGNLMSEIAKNTSKSYKLLDRWDGQGLPKERSF